MVLFRFPSCCICFTQRTFYSHFELLRNAVDGNKTALLPFPERRSGDDRSSLLSSPRALPQQAGPADSMRGGRSSPAEGGGDEGGGSGFIQRRSSRTCNNRFCKSKRRSAVPGGQTPQRRRRRRRKTKRMSTPLRAAQQITQILLQE